MNWLVSQFVLNELVGLAILLIELFECLSWRRGYFWNCEGAAKNSSFAKQARPAQNGADVIPVNSLSVVTCCCCARAFTLFFQCAFSFALALFDCSPFALPIALFVCCAFALSLSLSVALFCCCCCALSCCCAFALALALFCCCCGDVAQLKGCLYY